MNATDWCASIDAYCERTDARFWSEPLNAWSNAAFLIAALLAFRIWREGGSRDRPAFALIAITASVGVGSFLFHTFANRWSLVADVLPITIFIYAYFALAMTRYFGLRWITAALATVAFALSSMGFVRAWKALVGRSGVDWTNGSVGYFPAAVAMLAVGGLLCWRAWRQPAEEAARAEDAGYALLVAAAVFSVSLTFRSIDLAVCSWAAVGTHFLWHVLNAVVLFTLVRAAIAFTAAGARVRSP